ncbi:MAG: 50S ribosomal protein L13 [Chlamydiota bacterium]|nr:50S ribosomal protein L13 [Chlamydiota bacterium]
MSYDKRKQKTTQLTTQEARESRRWILFDAKGKHLGRMASELAKVLRGRHRPDFTPHIDCGDGVIVINAEKILVTGNKASQKEYRHYTGSMGGMRCVNYSTMMARKPKEILKQAVHGMMPKTKLGRAQEKRLRLFVGEEHGMEAQTPLIVGEKA